MKFISKKTCYIKDKPIDLIPIMLFVGKMVAGYSSKVTNTLYNSNNHLPRISSGEAYVFKTRRRFHIHAFVSYGKL